MDLNSLVKAYSSILYPAPVTDPPQQPISMPTTVQTTNQEKNGSECTDSNGALKRSNNETDNDSEPEFKRRNLHGAFEPVFKPAAIIPPAANPAQLYAFPSYHQPIQYRPMNNCCCDMIQRYTAFLEKELMNDLSRTTRQTLLNCYKFWHTIHPPVHPQPISQASNRNLLHHPTLSAANSLQQLNSLTNRIGGQTNFASIQALVSKDPVIKSEIDDSINNDVTSRGASVRKRKCKVTDMTIESPPTKSLLLSNGCQTSCSNLEYQSSRFGTSTLTSAHLRKAKLLFLYSRYPSSMIIKDYFPDVRFNKANTAQLVKWFSNFREYFYIQVEKFARQFASDPGMQVDDVDIDKCTELLKNLSCHYNRSNKIDIPKNFADAVIVALKEFFMAVRTGSDNESSWKKSIYKIISRLDVDIPSNMKRPDY